jgi:hypothetical protein
VSHLLHLLPERAELRGQPVALRLLPREPPLDLSETLLARAVALALRAEDRALQSERGLELPDPDLSCGHVSRLEDCDTGQVLIEYGAR